MNCTAIEFKNSDEEEMRALGQYVATLVKEGVQFTMKKDAHAVAVTLTGGY